MKKSVISTSLFAVFRRSLPFPPRPRRRAPITFTGNWPTPPAKWTSTARAPMPPLSCPPSALTSWPPAVTPPAAPPSTWTSPLRYRTEGGHTKVAAFFHAVATTVDLSTRPSEETSAAAQPTLTCACRRLQHYAPITSATDQARRPWRMSTLNADGSALLPYAVEYFANAHDHAGYRHQAASCLNLQYKYISISGGGVSPLSQGARNEPAFSHRTLSLDACLATAWNRPGQSYRERHPRYTQTAAKLDVSVRLTNYRHPPGSGAELGRWRGYARHADRIRSPFTLTPPIKRLSTSRHESQTPACPPPPAATGLLCIGLGSPSTGWMSWGPGHPQSRTLTGCRWRSVPESSFLSSGRPRWPGKSDRSGEKLRWTVTGNGWPPPMRHPILFRWSPCRWKTPVKPVRGGWNGPAAGSSHLHSPGVRPRRGRQRAGLWVCQRLGRAQKSRINPISPFSLFTASAIRK